MSENTQMVVGYDAREFWREMRETWPMERQDKFLYKFDVTKPLSIDTRVWPTIFESEQRPEPPGRLGFQSCWSDFLTLRTAVTRVYQQNPLRAYRMVAITLVLGPYCEPDGAMWLPRLLPPASPAEVGKHWIFLGYDVGDQWMLSALTNCGFAEGLDDVAYLRASCGPRLNEYHLFPSLDDAIEFKKFSDIRLKDDHAPCFVFGLWLVR